MGEGFRWHQVKYTVALQTLSCRESYVGLAMNINFHQLTVEELAAWLYSYDGPLHNLLLMLSAEGIRSQTKSLLNLIISECK